MVFLKETFMAPVWNPSSLQNPHALLLPLQCLQTLFLVLHCLTMRSPYGLSFLVAIGTSLQTTISTTQMSTRKPLPMF